MKEFDLECWLRAHSSKTERIVSELVFTHANGETSLLLPRDTWQDGILAMDIEPLLAFYGNYFGASIGNSQITYATNVSGGLEVSHGLALLDFEQLAERAQRLGVVVGATEHLFMASAGWMFFYTIVGTGTETVLRMYDRDFGTNRILNGLEEVFDQWWLMINSE